MRHYVLSHAEKAVLNALLEISDEKGVCTCKQSEIANLVCYSLPTVQRALLNLAMEGALRKEYDRSARKATYYLDLEYFQR